MEKFKILLKDISATIGAVVVIGGAVWKGFDLDSRSFTSMEKRVHVEATVEGIDPVKMYGEYIIDSIEEVNTQIFRSEQLIRDSLQSKRLDKMDSLIRLNVYLTNELNKKK